MQELDAELSTHEILHTGFRVRATYGKGVITEEALWHAGAATVEWSGEGGRNAVVIMLRGDVRARLGGKEAWAHTGELVSTTPLGASETREQGGEYVQLMIEWEPGVLGTRSTPALSTTRLGATALSRLNQLATHLRTPSLTPASTAEQLAASLGALRAEGAPFDAWSAGDLLEPAAVADSELAQALGMALSSIDSNPQMLDLETALHLSPRQVSRRVGAFTGRYGLNGSNWRSLRDRWRLNVASSVMNHPHATTGAVATAFGYGSPEALCHSFAKAGLPSPSNIRHVVKALL
jgi:AraC-like DNA-binding protein